MDRTYWWKFFWADGYNHRCTGPLPAGIAAMVAQNLNDGAFRSNQFGYEKLISISFFKAVDCAYWYPNRHEILRWYCRGYRNWYNAGNLVANILSFRGHTRWCMDRGGNTVLKRGGAPVDAINGRYTLANCIDPNLNVTYPSPPLVNGTRYGDVFTNGSPPYANQLPPYPVLPDRPLNLDVTVNTTYRNTGDWASTRSCHPGGSPCPGREDGVTWFVSWKDVPGYRYRGRRVQYAGFGETGIQSNAAGVIEEWCSPKVSAPFT
jgi:hypothetical protein